MTYKKNFFYCLLASIISLNCFAQEVTEEILMKNKWKCHEVVNKYANYDDNERQRMYLYNKPIGNFEVSYTKINGKLMERRFNFERYDMDYEQPAIKTFGYVYNKQFDEPRSTVNYKQKFIFISKDKFKKVSDSIARYEKSKKLSQVRHDEMECIRILN